MSENLSSITDDSSLNSKTANHDQSLNMFVGDEPKDSNFGEKDDKKYLSILERDLELSSVTESSHDLSDKNVTLNPEEDPYEFNNNDKVLNKSNVSNSSNSTTSTGTSSALESTDKSDKFDDDSKRTIDETPESIQLITSNKDPNESSETGAKETPKIDESSKNGDKTDKFDDDSKDKRTIDETPESIQLITSNKDPNESSETGAKETPKIDESSKNGDKTDKFDDDSKDKRTIDETPESIQLITSNKEPNESSETGAKETPKIDESSKTGDKNKSDEIIQQLKIELSQLKEENLNLKNEAKLKDDHIKVLEKEISAKNKVVNSFLLQKQEEDMNIGKIKNNLIMLRNLKADVGKEEALINQHELSVSKLSRSVEKKRTTEFDIKQATKQTATQLIMKNLQSIGFSNADIELIEDSEPTTNMEMIAGPAGPPPKKRKCLANVETGSTTSTSSRKHLSKDEEQKLRLIVHENYRTWLNTLGKNEEENKIYQIKYCQHLYRNHEKIITKYKKTSGELRNYLARNSTKTVSLYNAWCNLNGVEKYPFEL